MRAKGTKYDTIDQPPPHAMQVSVYAHANDIRNMNYVYVKYDRYLAGKGSHPGYSIRSWNGTNIVIPE